MMPSMRVFSPKIDCCFTGGQAVEQIDMDEDDLPGFLQPGDNIRYRIHAPVENKHYLAAACKAACQPLIIFYRGYHREFSSIPINSVCPAISSYSPFVGFPKSYRIFPQHSTGKDNKTKTFKLYFILHPYTVIYPADKTGGFGSVII